MMNGAPIKTTQQIRSEPDFCPKKEERELEKKQRAQFSHVGLVAAAFMLATLLAQIVYTLLLFLISSLGGIPGGYNGFTNSTVQMLLSAASMYLTAFPLVFLLMKAIPKCGRSRGESWGMGSFMAVLVISLGLGLAGNLLGQAVEHFRAPSEIEGEDLNQLLLGTSVWVNLLVTAVMAPVAEELLYRKLLMDRLLGYGEWAAVLVSGLMFGMAHGNFGQFFYTFGIGLVWAYVYARTGRISLTIVLHMIFNLIGGVLTIELLKGISGATGTLGLLSSLELLFSINLSGLVTVFSAMALLGYSTMMIGCVIAGITLLVVFRRKIRFAPGIWPIKKGGLFRTVFLNPGMLFYFLVCTSLFVLNW